MKLGHCVVDQDLGNFFEVLRCCVEQTGGGDIVDLSGDSRSVIMDEFFGLWFEDFI